MTQILHLRKHKGTLVQLEMDTCSLESCKVSIQILEVLFLSFTSDEMIINVSTHTRQAL